MKHTHHANHLKPWSQPDIKLFGSCVLCDSLGVMKVVEESSERRTKGINAHVTHVDCEKFWGHRQSQAECRQDIGSFGYVEKTLCPSYVLSVISKLCMLDFHGTCISAFHSSVSFWQLPYNLMHQKSQRMDIHNVIRPVVTKTWQSKSTYLG